MSFTDLDQKELYRSAVEDFAVDVEEGATAEEIRAAFLETGITWADYVAQHPEAGVVDSGEREPEPVREGSVITLQEPTVSSFEGAPEPNIVVAQPLKVNPNDKYLVKMTRGNTLYETRGHRFTKDHPYALVSAEDYEFIVEHEDGFRQALPSEVAEFYG